MTSLYDKYHDILKHVYNIMNLTDNEELKELSKKTIINKINQLCEKDSKNKEAYESILEEFGFVEKSFEKPKEEDDTKLNPIEQEEIPSKKDVEYKNAEEYVFYEIYRNENKALGDEFQDIMRGLISSLKSDDSENVVLYKDKYDKFVNNNKDILDVDILNEYYQKTYNKYNVKKTEENEEKKEDIEQTKEDKLDDIEEKVEEPKKEEKKKEEGLKILNVKRSYNSKLKNRALSLLALVGIGSFNPLLGAGLGVGAYYLYKHGIKNAKSLIEKNGLNIDENDNLIDSSGKVITEEEIGRIKYNLIKRELSKINDNGRIDSSYKKNKLTSMLLSVPSKMFKSIKDKYQKIKISKEEASEEIKDMNKGLGIIK